MKLLFGFIYVLNALLLGANLAAQTTSSVRGADERFKADILVVVAHPDDEGAVTPYLARAIYDLHKRVAVVYGTHGASGANNYGREHAAGLGDIREMEARESCARMGIKNVWFLDGKDTASQNVLNSLANWGHAAGGDHYFSAWSVHRREPRRSPGGGCAIHGGVRPCGKSRGVSVATRRSLGAPGNLPGKSSSVASEEDLLLP